MSTSMKPPAGSMPAELIWKSSPLARWISWSPIAVATPTVPVTRPAFALRAGVAPLRSFEPPGAMMPIQRSSAGPRAVSGITSFCAERDVRVHVGDRAGDRLQELPPKT
jgi:hypothetical protein